VVNLQELVNRRNPVTAYSPTRVLDRPRANAGTAQRILQSRAAPQQYQPRQQPSFGGGYQAPQVGAPQQQMPAMPNTAPPVRSLDEMLAHTTTPESAAGSQGGPGEQGLHGLLKETFGRTLGVVVNNPVGRAIMAPLNLLDYGRRAMVSAVLWPSSQNSAMTAVITATCVSG